MSASDTIRQLATGLQQSLKPLEVRATPPAADRLELVLNRADVDAACAILAEALGPPAKPFGGKARLDGPTKRLVESIGGIRPEQCLYLKPQGAGEVLYAALWPWQSDPQRVTVHLGVCATA